MIPMEENKEGNHSGSKMLSDKMRHLSEFVSVQLEKAGGSYTANAQWVVFYEAGSGYWSKAVISRGRSLAAY